MALTKISTDGVKDDAVTAGKIPANAVGTSEIANNAVTSTQIADNTIVDGDIADATITLNKLVHGTSSNDGKFLRANNGADPSFETVSIPAGTTINNNADNRVITGSGTANTLNGESVLTFDSSTDTLQVHQQNTGNNPAFKSIHRGGSGTNINAHFTNYSGTADTVILHDGSVGIGTTDPSGESINGSQNLVIMDTSSDGGINIKTGTSANAQIHFSDTSANGRGRLIYNHADDSMQYYTAGSERMRIDSSGLLGIGTTSPAKNLHVANSGVSTVRIETTDSRGQAWDLLSTYGSQNNTGTLSFRDESGSAYLEFGANGGSPKLEVRNGGANLLLGVDSTGNVTKPRNAFAIIHTQSGDAGVANNKIKDAYAVFTGVHHNQGSHYNTSNGRFTCPVDGVYGVAFSSNLHMSNMSVGNSFNIQTRKNGSIQLYNYNTVVTTIWQQMTFTNYVNCNANDYLQIYYGGSQSFGADQGSGQWGHLYFWLAQ